jgi:hypothetical protein
MSSCVWRSTTRRPPSAKKHTNHKRKAEKCNATNASEFRLSQHHNSIVAFVKKRQKDLEKEKEAIPNLRDEAAQKRAQAATMGGRWQVLARKDLLDEADQIDETVLRLESEEDIIEFTQESAEFLQRFMGTDTQFIPQAEPLPSTRKRKNGAQQRKAPKVDCRIITSSKKSGKVFREVLVDDFMKKHDPEFVQQAYCISDQSCDACGAMLVHDTQADVCVCVRCHRERVFAGGASAAKNSMPASGWRYRRLSNFKTLLDKFLGLHTSKHVNEEVYFNIMTWLCDVKKCTRNEQVNSELVCEATDALGYNSEMRLCKNGLTSGITNRHMDRMNVDERTQFFQLFCVIDCLCQLLREAGVLKGVNMMRYWFVMWGQFSILTWGQRFLKHFNLKDNRDNVARLSRDWDKVCETGNFHFVAIA